MADIKPHLFISHANGEENKNQRTIAIRDKLYKLLKKKWEVFLDIESIKPGDRWRPEVLHNLSRAQAGIILFDKNAIERSVWVKAEALILCFRKSIDPNIQLIPVLLDDLTLDNTCFGAYQPFELNAIQALTDSGRKTPQQIAKEIEDYLDIDIAHLVVDDFCVWMTNFKSLINKVEVDRLCRAWELLVSLPEERANICKDDQILCRAVTQLFHHKPPMETLIAVNALKGGLDMENISRMCEMLRGKWIENESVEVFFNAIRGSREKVLLTYNTPSVKPIDYFFKRIGDESPDDYFIQTITISGCYGDGIEVIEYYIERAIKHSLRLSESPDSDGELQSILSDRNNIIVCYIAKELANSVDKRKVLKKIQEKYKRMIFIIQIDKDEDEKLFEELGRKKLTPSLTEDKLIELPSFEFKLNTLNQACR